MNESINSSAPAHEWHALTSGTLNSFIDQWHSLSHGFHLGTIADIIAKNRFIPLEPVPYRAIPGNRHTSHEEYTKRARIA